MHSAEFLRIARRLMAHPAAPYFEHDVRKEAQQICREHALPASFDAFGNLLVKFQTARGLQPLALAAHLDHPGFHLHRQANNGLVAQFHGGVSEDYFKPGLRIRLMPGAISAQLGRKLPGDRRFEVATDLPSGATPTFAVWELEDFSFRRRKIVGRACDDLIGVATVLATLIELKRHRAKVNVIGVISRAEEVGFHGALMVAKRRALPANTLVISLETSREVPPVQQGGGVIVRVGDRASVFDSAGTRFLTEVANGIRERDRTFQFQRALMPGGTCEGTAFQEFGYQTAAVCVALGNYHNCGARKRISAEFVSLADATGMQRLLVEVAQQMKSFEELSGRLRVRLDKLAAEATRCLPRIGDAAPKRH